MHGFLKKMCLAGSILMLMLYMVSCQKNNTHDVQESAAGLTVKDIYELDLGETPVKWTDGSLEIAKSLYTGWEQNGGTV